MKLKVILAHSCCGKTSLKRKGYVDLDLPKKAITKKLIENWIKNNKDDSDIYLMEISLFEFFGLHNREDVEVLKVYLPEETSESLSFREEILKERDLHQWGAIRPKRLYIWERDYYDVLSFCKKQGFEIQWLKPNQFLSDFL